MTSIEKAIGQPSSASFDQAAAAMAAESAQMAADAERVAARAATSTVVELAIQVDTSALEVALGLAERLKAALASVMPAGLSNSVADLGPFETRTCQSDQVVRGRTSEDPITAAKEWLAGAQYNSDMGMPLPPPTTLLEALQTLA